MVVNYKEHGFRIVAKAPPESCTACPFWLTDMKTLDAMCYITGRDVPSDPKWDETQMDNCPIEKESADVSADVTDTNVGNMEAMQQEDPERQQGNEPAEQKAATGQEDEDEKQDALAVMKEIREELHELEDAINEMDWEATNRVAAGEMEKLRKIQKTAWDWAGKWENTEV